jgi:cyclopropane fatty-acyl-phospholipid synthase-like methyltransferase
LAFFDNQKNVNDYIKMAVGYDGRELIDILKAHLPAGSSVLELGMGPGIDLQMLDGDYAVTGSDSSKIFIDLYREKHPDADLLELDAQTIQTDRVFDCIYSNKVMHHLTKDELHRSFTRQRELLTEGGLLMHSFWFGSKEETHQGLRFIYYTESALMGLIGPGFETLKIKRYDEMEEADSFYVLLRKSD